MHLKIVLAAALALLGAGAAQAATVKVEFTGFLTSVDFNQPYFYGDTITYGFVIDDSLLGTATASGSRIDYTPSSSYVTINGALVANTGSPQQTVGVTNDASGADFITAAFYSGVGFFHVNLVDFSAGTLNDGTLVEALSELSLNGLSGFSVANGVYNEGGASRLYYDFQSVTVMAAIPLPASALLLGVGVAGLGAVSARRRRRNAA